MARKQTRKNMHYFTLRVNRKTVMRFPTKARNASRPVVLSRTLEDVMQGQEGLAITCANAECGLREAEKVFGHKAYMVEFTDNRAYVCDKVNKEDVPTHCVVYAHNQGNFQKAYDTKGKNALAKMSGVEGSFVLYPPPPRNAAGQGRKTSGGPSGASGKKKRVPHRKGAIARAERSGINLTRAKKSA